MVYVLWGLRYVQKRWGTPEAEQGRGTDWSLRSKRHYSSSQTWPFGFQICHFAAGNFRTSQKMARQHFYFSWKNGEDSFTRHDLSDGTDHLPHRGWQAVLVLDRVRSEIIEVWKWYGHLWVLIWLVLWFSTLSTLFSRMRRVASICLYHPAI